MDKKSILYDGQILGKYRILTELGRGGMGCVYLAEDQSLSRRVAIKVIWHHDAPDDSFIEKLAHEAKVIANLSHPNVVHVHAFDVIDDIPVIEMEYIQGGSLASRLRHEFVLPGEAVRHAHGISRALSYSHEMGAIHRDVKPSNILIDQHEQARLADFGIAKALAESEMIAFTNSRSGMFRGTPYYAPPEAWDGQEPTETWDIYSLGAVLFESITGAPPHVANTPLELARKMATENVEPVKSLNPQISAELGDLIDELLQRDADQRPESAKDVSRRLEKVPEFESLGDNDAPTARFAVQRKRQGLPHTKPGALNWRRLLGVAAFVAVFVSILLWWESETRKIWLDAFNRPESVATDSHRRSFQDLSTLSATDSLQSLLSSWKSEENQSVFTVRTPGSTGEMYWLASMSNGNLPRSILGFSMSQLMQFDLSDASAGENVSGHWASLEDSGGTVFRSGTVHGELYQDDETKALLGSLVFVSQHDGAVTETVVTAVTAPAGFTDTKFAYLIEESPFLTPMLSNEMRPRDDLRWGGEFGRLLPVFGLGSATVHLQNGSAAASVSAVDFDSAVIKKLVETGGALPKDVLVGIPLSATPVMRVSIVPGGVQFDLSATLLKPADGLRLELAMVRTLLVPIEDSPTFQLIHHTDGGVSTESIGGAKPEAIPTTSSVESRMLDSGSEVVFEVTIPFSVFEFNSGPPQNGDRLRIGAAVYQKRSASEDELVAHWGFPLDGVAKHGAVVRVID